jgi:hypothetical protein
LTAMVEEVTLSEEYRNQVILLNGKTLFAGDHHQKILLHNGPRPGVDEEFDPSSGFVGSFDYFWKLKPGRAPAAKRRKSVNASLARLSLSHFKSAVLGEASNDDDDA